MTMRTRKLIGAFGLLALVCVWALVGMALAQSALTDINGWMATIQYRDQILARNRTMPPHSGGMVYYEFQIAEDLDPAHIRLGVETPELWQVAVNGRVVDASMGECWLDKHIRLVGIGDHLRRGENVVTLAGHPFDVRREIDQIYLLGDFSGIASDPGFRLERTAIFDSH